MVSVNWISVEAVIFDMDGLLLDTESLSRKAWAVALEGTPYNIEPIYPHMLGTGVIRCNEILRNSFGPDFPLEELRAKRDAALSESMKCHGVTTKSGAKAMLEILTQRGIHTALATSSSSDDAAEKLRLAHLNHRFQVSAFGDEVMNTKPAPDLYLLAAERLNLSSSQCLVLEDSHAGVEAALAATMQVVMVPDLAQPLPWIAERRVPVVRSLQELVSHYLRES